MSLNCGWVNHTFKLAIGWSTVCYHGNPKFLGLQIGVQTLGCLCKTLTKWMKLLPLTQDFPYNYMRLHPLISETPPIIAQTPPPPHCWTRPPTNIASSQKLGKGPYHTCKLCHMSAYYVTIICLTWSHGSQLLFRMALQSRWSDLATEWLQAGKSCEASGAVSWITLECSLLLRELRSNNTTKPLIIRAFSCSSYAWERGFAVTVLH